MSQPLKRVGIVIAMSGEALPVVKALSLKPTTESDPALAFKSWTGTFAGIEILLKTQGKDERFGCPSIGILPAALATYKLIEEFTPDLTLNAGTAGGLRNSGVQIGDVYLGKESVGFHDRRLPKAMFADYGRGSYQVCNVDLISSELGFKTGKVSTGSSFDFTKEDSEEMTAAGSILKDMEAAAIAWVANLKNTPLLPIKVVTDLIGGSADTSEAQFNNNYRLATANLTDAVIKVLDYLSRHGLGGL